MRMSEMFQGRVCDKPVCTVCGRACSQSMTMATIAAIHQLPLEIQRNKSYFKNPGSNYVHGKCFDKLMKFAGHG